MKTYKWNVKTFIANMILLAITLFLLWFAASWIDICLHNGLDDGEPNRWNILVMLVDKAVNV